MKRGRYRNINGMSYEEIGNQLGISKELAFHVCKAAITKLRKGMAKEIQEHQQFKP